ncbi:MAG: MotA/TolQ/ExbB proton channel family protein [Acidobacteriota bacterium]|nr:MotA/TolQ/ExbB proton channel family protein [Acidobacteriota bacterium]MDQ7086550.1 MotA/TolQ/ExbB proton channel family protein [Acidobacteriota bacterium]
MIDAPRRRVRSARLLFYAVTLLSASALLGLSVVRGRSMIDMLSEVITRFVVPLNAFIMFAFAVILSLIVGIFLHYLFFELRDPQIFDRPRTERWRASLQADGGTTGIIGTAREAFAGDETVFAHILLRFLGENGPQSARPASVWLAIQDEEFDRLKRNLVFLSFASVVSPALGFLGTAVGMVAAFYEISIQDSVTPADLALSIQIALITTVIGLVLKTLAMVLKTFVMHSITRREDQLFLVYQRLFER